MGGVCVFFVVHGLFATPSLNACHINTVTLNKLCSCTVHVATLFCFAAGKADPRA